MCILVSRHFSLRAGQALPPLWWKQGNPAKTLRNTKRPPLAILSLSRNTLPRFSVGVKIYMSLNFLTYKEYTKSLDAGDLAAYSCALPTPVIKRTDGVSTDISEKKRKNSD